MTINMNIKKIYIYILIYVTYQKEENLNFTIFKSITGYEPYL